MNEQTDNYTGPVWARFVGDVRPAILLHINGKTFFKLRGYDSLKELKSESDTTYSTVDEFWPRETWWTKTKGFVRRVTRAIGKAFDEMSSYDGGLP